MTVEQWVVAGSLLMAVSGVPGLFPGRHSLIGQRAAALILSAGAVCGLRGVASFFAGDVSAPLVLPSPLIGHDFRLGVDALSALFLLPILIVFLLASVYGLEYWKQTDHPQNGRKLSLFFGLLAASLTVLVVAQDGLLFLFAWEVMAISAFVLVATEDHDAQVREAGWLYLAASHFATLCLFALFSLIAAAGGSYGFSAITSASPALATAIFLTALVGFGTKAGIMPLHIWLPSAHAMAPSHVSAVLSGVMIKMGIYGLVRVCSLLAMPPLWWGALLLALGVISGVLGVAFAIGQHDLKRLLAYHSIENIGIIVMGLGLAMIGRSLGRADWVVLGLAGALLHVWNHALFKSLLFLSAGSVIHAAHTRDIDHLGGLAKRMPATATAFLIGAVAICGLPPLNGFVSELLIYLGLFRTLGLGGEPAWPAAAFAVPALAMIGALAAACFAKAYGAVFLGSPRVASHSGESGLAMLAPMAVLAVLCFLIGTAPLAVAPLLQQAIGSWDIAGVTQDVPLTALVPLGWISVSAVVLLGLLAAGSIVLWRKLARSDVGATVTWDCGFAAPSPRMQYTASSFAEMLVGLFGWALQPRTRLNRPQGLFPQGADFHSDVPDTVLDRGILPAFRFLARSFSWFRVLQQGNIQVYLLYIFTVLVFLLLWR